MSLILLDIWNTLVQHNITCLAYHLSGCKNYNADWLSRSFSNYINDFSLESQTFACIIEQLPFPLKIDIFASKYSFKLSHYVRRYFYPSTWKVDAFSFPWPNNIYDFLPLSQNSKDTNEIWSDEVEDIAFITLA